MRLDQLISFEPNRPQLITTFKHNILKFQRLWYAFKSPELVEI